MSAPAMKVLAAADEDGRLHLGVGSNRWYGRREPLAHMLAQRVDRRVVDPDRADDTESRLLVAFDGYGLAELHGYESPLGLASGG